MLALLTYGGWRAAVGAAAATFALQAAVQGGAYAIWGAAWFQNTIGMLDNGIDFRRAVILAYSPVALQACVPMVIASALAWKWRARGAERQFLSVAWAMLLAFAIATALKFGSADNYFIDSYAAAALLIGCGYADLRRRHPHVAKRLASAAAAALALWAPFKLFESSLRISAAETYGDVRPAYDRAVELLATRPGGWICSDDARLACLLPDRACLPQMLLSRLAKDRGRLPFAKFPVFVARGDLAVLGPVDDFGLTRS